MATTTNAPELIVMPVKTAESTDQTTAPTFTERVKSLLHEIFDGHEEYLGVTPD